MYLQPLMAKPRDASLPDPPAPVSGGGLAFTILFRFHLRVGARLALRRLAPVAAVFLALYVFLRPEFFAVLIFGLGQSGGWPLATASAVFVWMFAVQAAPRIFLGSSGWLRHLPSFAAQRRRSALAGMWVSLSPVFLGLAFVYVMAHSRGGTLNPVFLIGLPVLGWAAAQATLPVQNKNLVRPLSFLAAILAASGGWLYLGFSLALLGAADLLSGPFVRSGRAPVRTANARTRGLAFFITWRALRWRLGLWYLLSAPPFLLTYAYLTNSVVTPLQRQRALLFGIAAALVVFTALAANGMAARRPVWPWLRCLPGSARSRILTDAAFLWLHAMPILIPLAILDLRASAAVVLGLPALSLYAAVVIRLAPEQKMSALGLVSLNGALGGMLLALLPPTALVFVGGLPFLLRYGVSKDRAQKVSRWLEIHHLAAGDPYSWSRE